MRVFVFALMLALAAGAPAAAAQVVLAPHRAIYDLKLLKTTGARGISAVRGRILYDFSGNACEGYTLKFRQVSEIQSAKRSDVLSDLRATTWEDEAAEKFSFNSQNLLNDRETSVVDGHAARYGKAVSISLRKPARKKFELPANTVFPTDHMRRIIEAAWAGKTILQLPVYDGSDNGQKLYNTLTVIGKAIPPGAKPPHDASAKIPALAKLTRWPVTISYFDKESARKEQTGEQTPVYALTFELYENGVSRSLILDYSDFTLSGDLTGLEMKNVKPCK